MLALLSILLFSLQFASVQTFLTKKVANYLSKELSAKVSLDRIYIKPFSSISLNGFSLTDQKGMTILQAKELQANVKLRQLLHNKLVIEELTLDQGFVNFQIHADGSNFQFLIDYFTPRKTDQQPTKKGVELSLQHIKLKNNHFKYINHTKKHQQHVVDFSDIDLQKLNGEIANIFYDSTHFSAAIKQLKFIEKSGFQVKELSTSTRISSREMEFDQLKLITNRSEVGRYLKFTYQDFSDFSDFIHKVHMESTFDEVYVDSRDIEYFAPDLKNVRFTASLIQGKANGTVSNLQAQHAHIKTGKETELIGDFSIVGLPNINQTIFDFQLASLQSSATDVELLVPQLANRNLFKLPTPVHQFGKINYQGTFHGFYNDFAVEGNFQTNLGDLSTKTAINLKQGIAYSGSVIAPEFQIGKLLSSNSLKNTKLDLSFSGEGLTLPDLSLQIDGSLNHFQYNDYQYDSVAVHADLLNQLLGVRGDINDRNVKLAYESQIDFQQDETIYDIDASIDQINFNQLGLFKQDSILVFDTFISTQLKGNNLNNLNGNLSTGQISMSTKRGEFTIENLFFSAEGNEKDRLLLLTSNVLDAEMKGVIDLNTIVPYFKALAMRYAPAIGFDVEPYREQDFDLKVTIKSFDPVSAFLDPNLTLQDGARLNAQFSSSDYTAKFSAYSPLVKYKGFHLQNLEVEESADEQDFSLKLTADKFFLSDSLFVNKVVINNVLAKDSLFFQINASEEQDPNILRLNGNIHFAQNKPAYIQFNKSDIIINHEPWALNTDAQLRVSKGKFYLNNLKVTQGKQKVLFDGIISNEDDQLNVSFDHFNLRSLEPMLNPLGVKLDGELNGNFELHSIFKKPYLSANINTSPLVYNKIPIGQLKLLADFNPEDKKANLDIQLLDDRNRGLNLKGYYLMEGIDQTIQLTGTLKEAELILLQPFVRNLASNLEGKVSADLEIGGTLKRPKIKGIAKIQYATLMVNYLKTTYQLTNETAIIDQNNILINNLKIADDNGHLAHASGIINLNNLRNPYIDVDISTNNFMILNTNYKDNNLFYGKAYATGTFAFKGQTSAIDIDIKARSEENTSITIPFNNAMTVTDSDFIYFVSKDSSENKVNASKYFLKGLTMNMDLTFTPSAEVNLQTDLGSLRGNGTGEISLKLSTLGDFEMFGDYVVNSGKFHFTAQDFINKYFDIKQGGTIRWTGSPSAATINLVAIYQQRTSIGALYNAAGRAGQDERVLAQADMNIKGTLSRPDVTFDLNFPQNPYVRDELQTYLLDANNVNQQALSLIVRRSFTASSSNEIGREVNNTLLSAGTEIAFNQLNNILAQSLNINFLDFNIRSLNDASASFRFFNDRLVLTGGVVDRRNIQTTDLTFFSNQVATDAELTYKVRRDGSLMFRAYNRLNTRNILFTPTDDYINAVGIVYRQEFNTFREFWKKMWMIRLRKESEGAMQKLVEPSPSSN